MEICDTLKRRGISSAMTLGPHPSNDL